MRSSKMTHMAANLTEAAHHFQDVDNFEEVVMSSAEEE